MDIGYDTTEVSILSLGGIVLSRLIKTGGLKFDEAVRQTVRREFNLLIGQKQPQRSVSPSAISKKRARALLYTAAIS